jgi:hypothetical protein
MAGHGDMYTTKLYKHGGRCSYKLYTQVVFVYRLKIAYGRRGLFISTSIKSYNWRYLNILFLSQNQWLYTP